MVEKIKKKALEVLSLHFHSIFFWILLLSNLYRVVGRDINDNFRINIPSSHLNLITKITITISLEMVSLLRSKSYILNSWIP